MGLHARRGFSNCACAYLRAGRRRRWNSLYLAPSGNQDGSLITQVFSALAVRRKRPLQDGKDSSVTAADTFAVCLHPYLEPLLFIIIIDGRPFGGACTGISRAHIFSLVFYCSLWTCEYCSRDRVKRPKRERTKKYRDHVLVLFLSLSLSPFSL